MATVNCYRPFLLRENGNNSLFVVFFVSFLYFFSFLCFLFLFPPFLIIYFFFSFRFLAAYHKELSFSRSRSLSLYLSIYPSIFPSIYLLLSIFPVGNVAVYKTWKYKALHNPIIVNVELTTFLERRDFTLVGSCVKVSSYFNYI